MPSWNVHTAHVERLLREHTPGELGIRDVNCFLFGNFLPDVYVGYMVPGPTKTIDYRVSHFADPHHMPEPRYQEFWERYAEPSRDKAGRVSDVTLGAWAHLVADCFYNHNVNRLVDEQGLTYGDPLRVRKQGDFDKFGHTLDIHMVPEATPELIAQCSAFPQYEVVEPDVRAAVDVARDIVRDTRDNHLAGEPDYSLLSASFFARVADEVNETITRGLIAYAGTIAGD
ncbi:MAG: hypothetical protein U0L51_03405 [Olegusella sp.]|nr:hypothetical protein [Olegusella sp.]